MPSAARELLGRVAGQPFGLLGLVLVALVIGAALFAPWLATHDPLALDIPAKLQPPSTEHWLGTDQLGRDVYSRLLYGARVAMGVAVVSIGLAAAIGLGLGLLAGYGPRWLDYALLFLFDCLSSIPLVLFALAVVVILGSGAETLMLVIVLVTFPVYARLVRTQTLALRQADFVLAARSIGASPARIVGLHLLPNVLGPIVVLVSMDIPFAVSLEASLSFLGFGVKPPTPSWGTILNDGYGFIRDAPTLVLAAGAPLVIATLGFTFLGESLRDALDPKLLAGRPR